MLGRLVVRAVSPTAEMSVEVRARIRRKWALNAAGFAGRRGWKRLGCWVIRFVRVDMQIGHGRWEPVWKIAAEVTRDGVKIAPVRL